MLYQSVSGLDLNAVLKSRERYRPFPAYTDRTAWAAIPGEIKAHYETFAWHLRGMETVPPLRARRYMDFKRDGNRNRYEAPYFSRRANLFGLVIAECIAGSGAHPGAGPQGHDLDVEGEYRIVGSDVLAARACHATPPPRKPPR